VEASTGGRTVVPTAAWKVGVLAGEAMGVAMRASKRGAWRGGGALVPP
jgi:hypothetical protein